MKLSEECQHVECWPCGGTGIIDDGVRVTSGMGPDGEEIPVPEPDCYPCQNCDGTGKVIIVPGNGSLEALEDKVKELEGRVKELKNGT